MVDFYTNYRTTIFCETIEVTTGNIAKLLAIFKEEKFLPNVYNGLPSVTFGTPINTPVPTHSVLDLRSSDGSLIIRFGPNRIDISTSLTSATPSGIGELDAFIQKAESYFDKIFKEFPRTFNRLAVAANAILAPLTSEGLDKVYHLFFSPIDFYKKNTPIEWNTRQVAQKSTNILGNQEDINVVTSLSKTKLSLQINGIDTLSDRIIIDFDVNTAPTNLQNRFSIRHYNEFTTKALEYQNKVLQEYKGLMYEA